VTKWQSNILTREGDPDIGDLTATEKLHEITDVTENFHLFAIIWTPDYVAWEVDSVEVRRVEKGIEKGTHADKDQVAFLTEEESLRFNLWASKTPSWTGKFTGKELADGPKVQWIDYVRIYTYNESSKTFALKWQDDFNGNALDDTRWTTGNWEMELTTHSPNNVVVEDGYCKLLMTRVLEPVN
jgi:beta-glucanase (GH16 family)